MSTAFHSVPSHPDDALPGAGLSVDKMPAHWLMARLGKRVLRPGGREMTRWLLDRARIDGEADVLEFAPGLGTTARLILAERPRSYTGVERDDRAARVAERAIVAAASGVSARVLQGDAASVPVPDAAASVVIGEAMLSMQPAAKKTAIAEEAYRVLRPGGVYLIHELAVAPDTIDPVSFEAIQQELSGTIHVGVRIMTRAQWMAWIEAGGFTVENVRTTAMRLLDPGRLLRDEGFGGTARFLLNACRTRGALRRLRDVRRTFHRHAHHLQAIGIVAKVRKPEA